MRKIYSLFALCALFLFIITPHAYATVLLTEHFNQATSTLATNDNNSDISSSSDWSNTTGSGQIYMSSTNLSYSGYKSTADATGGSAEYKTTFGKKVAKKVSIPVDADHPGSVYVAGIIKISSSSPSTTPSRDYLWSFCNTTTAVATAGNHYGQLAVQKTSEGLQLGIAKSQESKAFLAYTDNLTMNTNYLVVMEYKFVSGAKNDIVYLYLNPTKGNKPEPTLECYQSYTNPNTGSDVGSGTKDDPSQLVSFLLYSTSSTKVACLIDELKIVSDWSDLWEAGEDPDPEPVVPVPAPAASSITLNSAAISWPAVEGADSYVFQWKVNGGSWSSDIAIDKDVRSYSMSGLESETKYFVRVKTIIGEDASDWAEINFTTAAEPATIMYNGITFNKYATTNAMPTSGTYYLAKNVTFGNLYAPTSVTLTGDLTLYLYGRTLTPFNACIIVPNGVTLTIYEDADGQIYGGYSGTYLQEGMITVQEGGTLIVSEGKIENYADPSGSSYAIANYGTFKLSGAPVITGESASIHLGSGNVITFESGNPLTNTTEHKYSVNAAGQLFTSGWRECMGDATPTDHFVSAKSGYSQILRGNSELYLTYGQTFVLSEDNNNASLISEAVGGSADYVLVDRVFTNTQYNTICLPFALTQSQLEYTFGSGFDLREFTGSSMDGDVLSLNFASRSALEAGKPYLIKPSQVAMDILRNGINISVEEPVDQTSDAYISFHGTFNPTELEGGNKNILFLGQDNELFWPASTGNIKGFRAYFEVKGGAAQAAKRARIVLHEDAATGLEQTSQEPIANSQKLIKDGQLIIERNGTFYNAQGQVIK